MAKTGNPRQYTVQGTVTDQNDKPLQGVLVRATDHSPATTETLLGKAVYTNAKGKYTIAYTDENFTPRRKEKNSPDIIVRVFSSDGQLLGKSDTHDNAGPAVTVDIKVQREETVPRVSVKKRVVTGHIQLQEGQPARQFFVAAYHQSFRSEQLLGEASTDMKGNYKISYVPDASSKEMRKGVDLFIKVSDPKNKVIGKSGVLFNAPVKAVIDYLVAKGESTPISEFESIHLSISPLLEGVEITKLDESDKNKDITFLSGQSSYSQQQVQRFVQAHYFEIESKIEAPFWYVVLGIPFYGDTVFADLAGQREHIDQTLGNVEEQGIEKALKAAFAMYTIAPVADETLQAWLAAFKDYKAQSALNRTDSFANKALEDAGIKEKAKQTKFTKTYQKHRTFSPEMVEDLKKEKFKAAEVKDLQTTYELSGFTHGNFELTRAIKQTYKVNDPKNIRLLAKNSEQDWINVVEKTHEANPIKVPLHMEVPKGQQGAFTQIYGKAIHKQFCTAFPTMAFSGGLDRALENEGVSGLKQAKKIKKIIDKNPNFELLATPIDSFAKTDSDLKNDDDLKIELKAVQRVFKLNPDFDATNTLMKDKLHSAHNIYRVGESEFINRYKAQPGFTKEKARATWRRAEAAHAASVTLVAELKATENAGAIAAFSAGNEAVSDFPNWNNLFKGGDLCECKHCRSVYSPAAYFADLLMFLKDRRPKGIPVKDMLFERRPDLGYLELNCENANVTLPYIDVVNEVLETVVANGESDVELNGFTAIVASDMDQAVADVQAALQTVDLNLGDNVHLAQVGTTDDWVIHSDTITYLLKKKGGANYFAEILRNTKAQADELRANPQYVNANAYQKLSAAKFPLALPFDLFAEETKASFEKVKIDRWRLMQLFRGNAAPNNATDGEVAAIYFGISVPDEKDIILQAAPGDQFELWGEGSNADLLNKIKNVKTFLGVTGLKYNELLTLLDLAYINPDGVLQIDHLDPTCDTDKKEIKPLDVSVLDRINRFLRLWRKLGWELWEVDMVIRHTHIGNGSLNEAFLVNLMYLVELKHKLGKKVSIEEVCGLFGNLNTTTRFTELHEKREDALYQELFLNKKLINPLDPAFEVAQVDAGANTEKIVGHKSVIQAALGLKESDLDIYLDLKRASDGSNYIPNGVDGDLILGHLSFVYRHAFLAKQLKIKAADWQTFLKLHNTDALAFTNPKSAHDLVSRIQAIKGSEFDIDTLNYVLTADMEASAASNESAAARFLMALRNSLQDIADRFDPAQYEFLQASPPADTDSLTALLISLLQLLNKDDQAINYILNVLENTATTETEVQALPAAFEFPNAISSAIKIRYNDTTKLMRFTGLMTDVERNTLLNDSSLASVTGIPAYQQAIAELYQQARLAVKFFVPKFNAMLSILPDTIDFKSQLSETLASKISYNALELRLEFDGIMTKTEKDELDVLSADAPYLNAVNSLYTQPMAGIFHAHELWLAPTDLDYTVAGYYEAHLALGVGKLLIYLKETETENTIIQLLGEEFEMALNMVDKLVNAYQLVGTETIFEHLKNTFGSSFGVVDYASFKDTFDTYYWLHKLSLLANGWGLNFEVLEWLVFYHAPTQTLDFGMLPMDDTGTIATLDNFLRTQELLQLNSRFSVGELSILRSMEKLHLGDYATSTDFAVELEELTEWNATDISDFVNHVNLTYHTDYLLAENWTRLYDSMKILEQLNASMATTLAYANARLGQSESQNLKQLLRSKYGTETWLTISTEIQDVLREKKRNALAAYLLAEPQPTDAPSGKWEHTNDLYAYYLLDIEMSSCMLTSRLVQGSGSIQLFVQRCFMGLEPEVPVKADGDDGDSAWYWWKWMRKYRVWEANRKVFLYPENWIEPELRRDKSTFFADLENELLQNEVNQTNVELAYLNYLDKLNEVARLDIAAFYHEDDADNTIIHVFGRTANADPHIYYYRQFDYRRWIPWERMEVDIVGDHLIPMVINKRLYVFWPEFREEPDEELNNNSEFPSEDDATLPLTYKRTQLRLAGSEYRNKKWTPKKVSKEYFQSTAYTTKKFDAKSVKFYPIDRSDIDGRIGIKCSGTWYDEDGDQVYNSSFELFGCEGVPVIATPGLPGSFSHIVYPEESNVRNLDYVEKLFRSDSPENDFSLRHTFYNILATLDRGDSFPLLFRTPNRFDSHFAWHLSYMDKLLVGAGDSLPLNDYGLPVGSWLPFFYADKKKTFMAFPMLDFSGLTTDRNAILGSEGGLKYYYPEIKGTMRDIQSTIEGYVRNGVDAMDFGQLTDAQKLVAANIFAVLLDQEPVISVTDDELREMIVAYFMRIFNFYLGMVSALLFNFRRYHFKNFYHPFVCDFIKTVYNPTQGIPAMMSRDTQLKNSGFSFRKRYIPTPWVYDFNIGDAYPEEVVDFSPDGSYSPYNWELFYHTPLMIANSLSKNQRFEEAMEWYHYIFNPLGVEGQLPDGSTAGSPQKYWITKPFFLTTDADYNKQRIDTILRMIAGDDTTDGYSAQLRADLEAQVRDWRNNPFEPHRIAQYRNVAYQKTVFMKYLDNLVAWGDHLFRQDSMESINEATQLYILAAELLGPRPQAIPPQVVPPIETFNELENDFDDYSNALVQIENYIPVLPEDGIEGGTPAPIPTLYFCIPQNSKIQGYWDTIADRLYKIRNCMNIEGVVRQLSLFEPEIDPGALVKAVAGGMDLSSALADLNAPLPCYRFNILLAKANEVCNDVKALGNALLSALEKKDAEELALLRQANEKQLLDAVKGVRELQIDEAKKNLDGLKESKALTEFKKEYYASKDFMNAGEIAATVLNGLSIATQTTGTVMDLLAGVLYIIPDFQLGASGFGGSPHASAKTGGKSAGDAAQRGTSALYNIATIMDKAAAMTNTMAGYERRNEEWGFQKESADLELVQLDEQIAAAELRIQIAEKELANQELQIENSQEVEDFMTGKYTNKELYQWMIGQISNVYFKSYQLAYDLAKRAERCYRFELGLQDSSFIKFGYWDSLKKGLLSGDNLQYDLRRMESSYLEQNKRELELTKHVSLVLLDPLALIKLKETGKCFFSLPEEIFDLDYPGHYFRRIKSVSISLPCVAGPYTTISCSLRLLNNRIRIQTGLADGYAHNNEDGVLVNDSRFVQNNIPVKAIATSNAQNDSGMFQLNFSDERYLPFEGAGAISDWAIDLFNDSNDTDFGKALRQFDYNTISDAIVHISYTAREVGGVLKDGAIANLKEYFDTDDGAPAMKFIDLKHEFASAWHKLQNPDDPTDGNTMTFKMTKHLFPFRDRLHTLKVNSITLLARCSNNGDYEVTFAPPLPAPPPDGTDKMTLIPVSGYGNLHYDTKNTVADGIVLDFSSEIVWNLTIVSPTGTNLADNELEDLYVLLGYEWDD
ncbi:MAG: neuraminidase-like domain-containing protein [Bacteroidota bacterium]